MSARSSIAKALKGVLANITTLNGYNSTVHLNNIVTKLLFWDEVSDFPFICVVPGREYREYLPGDFRWGFLSIAIKLYVNGDNALEKLELLLEDVEKVIANNETLVYATGKTITEILITDITTDEGLLAPYGVGEIILQVRYEVDVQ